MIGDLNLFKLHQLIYSDSAVAYRFTVEIILSLSVAVIIAYNLLINFLWITIVHFFINFVDCLPVTVIMGYLLFGLFILAWIINVGHSFMPLLSGRSNMFKLSYLLCSLQNIFLCRWKIHFKWHVHRQSSEHYRYHC